mgnify:CR=1 FL=1
MSFAALCGLLSLFGGIAIFIVNLFVYAIGGIWLIGLLMNESAYERQLNREKFAEHQQWFEATRNQVICYAKLKPFWYYRRDPLYVVKHARLIDGIPDKNLYVLDNGDKVYYGSIFHNAKLTT